MKGRFTDEYGPRNSGFHYGQDIANSKGTDIHAMKDGVVLLVMEAYKEVSRGKYIYIDHGNGYRALYQHNDINLVQTGSIVQQGQVIAKIGDTGSRGSFHLHVELYENVPNDKFLTSMSPESELRKYSKPPKKYLP